MNIEKNNKVLADFMGWRNDFSWLEEDEYETPHNQERWIESGISTGWESTRTFKISEMLFHESWDWLMPVVEKIEDEGFGFQQYKNSCSITQDNTDDFWVINTQGKTKLEATHKAVVEFIKQKL